MSNYEKLWLLGFGLQPARKLRLHCFFFASNQHHQTVLSDIKDAITEQKNTMCHRDSATKSKNTAS